MQITIHVPDNLPAQRIYQRIRELEDSLREEAQFLSRLRGQSQAQADAPSADPWSNPALTLASADTGIADLSRYQAPLGNACLPSSAWRESK